MRERIRLLSHFFLTFSRFLCQDKISNNSYYYRFQTKKPVLSGSGLFHNNRNEDMKHELHQTTAYRYDSPHGHSAG